jgi:hypothetical protein
MTMENRRLSPEAETPAPDPGGEAIKAAGWEHFDSGSTVIAADGEEVGTVRERTPLYLQIRAAKNLLADVELYVPRDFVDRVEGDTLVLNRTSQELSEMDLSTPPALQD